MRRTRRSSPLSSCILASRSRSIARRAGAPSSRGGCCSARSLTLGIAALAVPVILLGFDGFFLRFHEVFFSGDTWRFSDTDTLLRIYPEDVLAGHGEAGRGDRRRSGGRGRARAWWWVAPDPPASALPGGSIVIDLHGPPGGVLRIGHRGAATLAPENTLALVPGGRRGGRRPDRVRRARPASAGRSCSRTLITSRR